MANLLIRPSVPLGNCPLRFELVLDSHSGRSGEWYADNLKLSIASDVKASELKSGIQTD